MKTIYLSGISVYSLGNIKGDLTSVICSSDGEKYFDNDYDELTFLINYPVNNPLQVKIENISCIADILVPIARAYKNKIYKYPEKYGVWGHDISDLYFEGIVINDDGTGEIMVGS